MANEVGLNFRGAGEAIGVIHVFFWKGIVTVQFQRAVHAGKLAFTGCTPVNETATKQTNKSQGPASNTGHQEMK